MARPVGIRFYEIPLPTDLPPNLQWMHLYHQNSEKLVCYLVEHGAGSTARHVALRCLLNLKDFLVSSNHEYSPDAALRWFDQSDFKNKGALVTLHRLSDLYQYGTVQPIHAFPVALPYYQGLLEVWKTILDDYLATLPLKQSAISQIRRCISRFFYRTQERGIQCPSEISFVHLETYYQDEAHTTNNETARYTYNVSDILLYMAEKGMCQHGLAWYLFFRMQGRILHLNKIASDQVQRMEAARTESLDFPAEDFAVVIPDFLKRLENLGYAKTNRNVAKYTLLNLLVFIEMHGLGYHPAIAEIWLEKERSRKGGSGWKQNRRIIQLFEVYTIEGDVIPQLFFRQKPLLSDGLPDWCKSRLDDFLSQKKREGWESSTIAMYRSCATRFCLYLCAKGFASFSDVSAATVTAFNRADKHLSAEGKNAYNVRIRNFLQFLERNGDMPYHRWIVRTVGYEPFWLFPSRNIENHIPKTTIDKVFKEFWRKTGASENCEKEPTPHSLRHTFVVDRLNSWILEGMDINVMSAYLSKFLGHQSWDESFYYYHLVDDAFRIVKSRDTMSQDVIPEVRRR